MLAAICFKASQALPVANQLLFNPPRSATARGKP